MKKVKSLVSMILGLALVLASCASPASSGDNSNNNKSQITKLPIATAKERINVADLITNGDDSALKSVWELTSGSGISTINGKTVYLSKDESLSYANGFIENNQIDLSDEATFDETLNRLSMLNGKTYTNDQNPQEVPDTSKAAAPVPGDDFDYFTGTSELNEDKTVLTITIKYFNKNNDDSISITFSLKKEGSTDTEKPSEPMSAIISKDGKSWAIGTWKIIDVEGTQTVKTNGTPITNKLDKNTLSQSEYGTEYDEDIIITKDNVDDFIQPDFEENISEADLKEEGFIVENPGTNVSVNKYYSKNEYKVSDDKTVISQHIVFEMDMNISMDRLDQILEQYREFGFSDEEIKDMMGVRNMNTKMDITITYEKQ